MLKRAASQAQKWDLSSSKQSGGCVRMGCEHSGHFPSGVTLRQAMRAHWPAWDY